MIKVNDDPLTAKANAAFDDVVLEVISKAKIEAYATSDLLYI